MDHRAGFSVSPAGGPIGQLANAVEISLRPLTTDGSFVDTSTGVTTPLPPRSVFRFSPTLKSIYLLRYLLFSGGAAIAGGMAQRLLWGVERPGAGLVIGWLVGLFLFRGQLRPFFLPALGLGREHLFFARSGKAISIPWTGVRDLKAVPGAIDLELAEEVDLPEGGRGRRLRLVPLDYGASGNELLSILGRLRSPDARIDLPTDAEVLRRLDVAAA